MSNLTFGPPVTIDDLRPEPPPHSLVRAPGVLQDAGDARWLNGVSVYPYPPSVPGLWDPCSAGTFRVKDEGDDIDIPVFASFVIVLPITCSAMSIGNPEEFANRAEVAMNAVESFAIEEQLSQGTGIVTNPYLADSNADVLAGGSAVSPAVALSYLENAIGETGKRGMIHATPAVVAQWFDQNRSTAPLITANGNTVVSGGGYIGADADGEASAAAGQSWVYATGLVEVYRAPVIVPDIRDVLDRSNNDVTFRAERYALVVWDTQLQAAILVDWTP